MGWDYTHATHYTRTGAIDKKAEIDELYAWQNDTKKYEVVRRCIDTHKQPGLFQFWS